MRRTPAGPRDASPLSYFKTSSLDARALKGGRGLLSFHLTSTFLSTTASLVLYFGRLMWDGADARRGQWSIGTLVGFPFRKLSNNRYHQ